MRSGRKSGNPLTQLLFMTIYKYPLEIADIQSIPIPDGAELLSVQFQRETLCLWALVDPGAPKKLVTIEIIGTGNPAGAASRCFISTVQQFNGQLVWHVFQSTEVRP